jgi:predicted nucleic acid-binding protein
MRSVALADTGFLLALLDRDDRWHGACADAFRQAWLPLLTTEAVLTELFHLVADSARETRAAWELVRSGALTLGAMDDKDLPALHDLMVRYADRPMDFADATLVHLARRESISVVLTIDHNDFETYRIGSKKRFTILPERSSIT